MNKWLEEFKEKMNSMSQEELDKKWEEFKEYNDIGPSIEEYIENLKKYGLYPKDLYKI